MKEYHIKNDEDWKRVREIIKPGDILVADEDVKAWGVNEPFRKGIKYEWGETKCYGF